MKSEDKIIYIAGPMRGYEDYNFPAFDSAKKLGESLGFHVLSPADMEREDLQYVKRLPTSKRQRIYAHRDIEALFQCSHIAMLPNWEKSVGATAEFAMARWLMLPILDATTFKPLNIENYQFTGVENRD